MSEGVMSAVLIWLHPLMQGLAVMLGIRAMWQGSMRARMLYWHQRILFAWKQHVRLGTWALLLWSLGALGFYVTHDLFGATHVTGIHAEIFWPVLGLSVFGLASGLYMDRYKRKRFWLPLVHGLANVVLLILVFVECWTGMELLEQFL